jgi:hypothetical protein
MWPTSLAIAWALWRRHRWGIVAVASFVAGAAIVTSIGTAFWDRRTVTAVLGPIAVALPLPAVYLIAVFSLGFNTDVGARESCFPAGLFRLPVSTAALVAWPMAYGAAALSVLWFVVALFVLRPWFNLWNMEVPLWWPAGLAVTTVACFQAVLWSPVGLPLFRIALTALLVPGLIALTEFAVMSGSSQLFLVALFASISSLAWTSGYVGVKRARRGDTPNWSGLFRPLRQLLQRLARRRQPFVSAARAQLWFEWRRTGLSLPVLTAVVLPFVLLPLIFGKNDAIPIWRTVLGALTTPLLLAGLAGTTVSGNHPWVKDYYGVAPFNASQPMTSADMVAAKLKAAGLSTLVAWTVMALMAVAALAATGNLGEVADWWERGLRTHNSVQLAAGVIAGTALLVVWTWKRMVDSLLLGISGRKWIIHACIYGNISGLVGLGIVAGWIYRNPESHAIVLDLLPWLLTLWVLCRLWATAWALRRALRRKLLESRTVLGWVLAGLSFGGTTFGVLAWVVPGEYVPAHYLLFLVLLTMPMAHLAATPLALAWNRHR